MPARVADGDIVGGSPNRPAVPHPGDAFASPKSSTFTVPSVASLMLAGFRSRWMMPCSCARVQRLGNLFRDRQRFVDRDRPACKALRQILALDQFHHQRAHTAGFFETVNVRDIRMVQGREAFVLRG